jgi:hypothetical protein
MHKAIQRGLRPASDRTEASLQLPPEDWRLLRKSHPNVLLTGGLAAASAALEDLRSCFRPPVVAWCAGNPLVLPAIAASSTLILTEAGSLSFADQHRLLAWLERSGGATQVITTTSCPLFTLVQRGAFLEALYDHLSVVCLDVASSTYRADRRAPEAV